MAKYLALEGLVTDVEAFMTNSSSYLGCTLTMTLQTYSQGIVNLTVTGETFVMENETIYPGDYITAFYDGSAPVPLIYPPRYAAIALVKRESDSGQYVLDYFDYSLTNSDNTLTLNMTSDTKIQLPNGQIFFGSVQNKLLLVEYRTSTRSIPAITTPEEIVVFCNQ